MINEEDRLVENDQRIVQAAKSIKILSHLGWPDEACPEFLEKWNRGSALLPKIEYPKLDLSPQKDLLKSIISTSNEDHPVGWYIQNTAQSYVLGAQMLESIGSAGFVECSSLLYGVPTEKVGPVSNLDIAKDVIKITDDFRSSELADFDVSEISARDAAKIIAKKAKDFFVDHKVKVVIEPHLSSKATAGSERVRLREGAVFSRTEIDQLFQHELLVHSVTMLNGRRQPYLKSMGLGSPRTTATQEGLATFAELISGTTDVERLRRIALRIVGIYNALNGADFIEVFRFFLDSGQTQVESFQSAARIFRGGDVRGRNVFTKDVVYLKGLLSVHAFLKRSIIDRKLKFPQYLFAGRLTLGDVFRFENCFSTKSEKNWVSPAQYLPPWVANQPGLAAFLAYNVFSSRLNVESLALKDFTSDVIDFDEM